MNRIVRVLACFCLFLLPAGTCAGTVNATSELSDKAESLLKSGQFAALDSVAHSLRQRHLRFPGGDPEIYAFYMALGSISDGNCGCSKGVVPFEVKRKDFAKWMSAEPNSPVARVGMALLWINYAWAARGGEFAPLVSPQAFRDYHERLQTASGYIASVDPAENLFVLYERSLMAEITPSPRDTIMSAFRAGVRADPTWFPIYAREAEMLKEKWYGQPGELARFAKSLLRAPDADTGRTAYAEMATALVGGIAHNDGSDAVADDWPRLRDAYATKAKRYRLSEDDSYALLQYAALFHDKATVEESLQLVRAYADEGYTLDMNNLGWAYLFGTGVQPQRDLAISWYRKGAALGNAISQYQLGWIFERTQGGGEEALKWYGLAGANGYSDATNNMGFMLESGEGVAQDYGRAAKLYQKAASEGDARAEYHLGTLYERGLGVAKDERVAMQWMLKAADGGDRDARSWLGGRAKTMLQPDKAI